MKKKEEIATMMDKDFESLLAQTNQLEDFQNGEIQCRICHRQIVIDNVGTLEDLFNVVKFHVHNSL